VSGVDGATRGVLARDTDAAVEARQIAVWRQMSPAEIAALVAGASRAVRALALAGLRARHHAASERELVARFAALTMGRDLARRAYPELDRLDP
jgi:hypothetical protein